MRKLPFILTVALCGANAEQQAAAQVVAQSVPPTFSAPAVMIPLPPTTEGFDTPPTVVEPVPLLAEQASHVTPVSAIEVMPQTENVAPAAPLPIDPDAYPIDLATAVHLAGGRSLAVALAREQAREAQARVMAADALWLPSIRMGLNYNKHEGVIQDVVGNAFNTSRGAFYSGMGAGAVGAGSPVFPGIAANFHLADALAQPLAARQTAASRSRATSAAMNDVLLEAAVGYMDLLARAQEIAVATEALDHAKRLGELTGSFAQSGEGTQADADRASTEVGLREIEAARADEAMRTAAARLTEILRLDPTLKLVPIEQQLEPLEIADSSLPVGELVARGLSARPELSEQRHLVAAAVERLRRERMAPLVPSLLIGTSYGGFGAGLGGDIDDFGDRFDFDAVAYWELRNLGVGDAAARSTAQAQVGQARTRQTAMLDRVAREVVEAHARVTSRRTQMEAARRTLEAADASYRRNLERIHGGVGLPLESLQSLQALATVRREFVRTVADFNTAQFQLQRALGYPIAAPEQVAVP
ncbi:MAG: TolC family protein [Planctomycetales bacterium]|nr:TolC family protein [Planctomycetales bacterium]MBN8626546.1 TolC family protein [Planctomycetota bacterium]